MSIQQNALSQQYCSLDEYYGWTIEDIERFENEQFAKANLLLKEGSTGKEDDDEYEYYEDDGEGEGEEREEEDGEGEVEEEVDSKKKKEKEGK